MKRTFTFLMTLFLTMGAMWAQVTSLEGFSQDKCYTFATSSRGAWAVDAEGTLFSSTGDQGLAEDATDTRQQFAVLSVNEADYYLYSVSAKKFIKADRTLVAGPADALAIADASSQGAGRVQFRFRDVNNSYINLGGSNQMSVDWWGTIDVGNAVLVSEAGDFNAAEALAMLSNVCTVTYEFTYEGEVKYTQEAVVAKGDAYPAVQPPFGTVAETPSGTVEEDVTVEVPLTVQLPFIAAADVESIDTWYYVQMHSNNKKYIQYLADQTYIEWADAEMDETAKDSYTWAFVGNVFDGFKVVNKAATIEKALQSTGGGDATMVAYAEGTQFVLAATSETSEGAQGGFCLRYPENNQYLNAQNGKIAHWGSTDAGSTFTVAIVEEEPEVPEVDPNDYTSYIKNADLSTSYAEGETSADWDLTNSKGIKSGYARISGKVFDFSQTITLPAGQYKMTAKAAYRFGGDEQAEYDAIKAGGNTHLAKLYAATASYKYETNVMNRYEGASDTDYAAGNGSVTVNGKFVPNSSDAVKAWFDANQYVNELVFNVQADGEVKIGIAKDVESSDYTNIGAWTLTRLGDAEADPEVEEPTPDPDPEEPGDDTEETVDLDMTHKVSRDWEGKSGNVTIDGIAMSERYEGNADPVGDQLWQTVTGLENGKYTVKLWANARVAWVSSPSTDGQEELTYIFANNIEKSIAVLHNPNTNGNVLRTLEGVEVTDGTLRMGMKKVAPGSNWHSIQIESLTLHATKEVVVNIAKAELQAAIDEANAVSPVTDALATAIAAAQAVYDNSNDKDEVVAATAALKNATVLANNTNAVAGASEENPVLTTFVVNGTFDSGKDPWKSTTGAQNQALADNQQGAFTGKFFENWNGSNYTGKLYQVIENIPNGVYELSICAFVETFDGSAQFVYANADKVALTTGAPTAYTVRTIVENNTIEVGFEQTAAVNRWCGIDNISLTYLGEASNEALVNAAKEAFTAAYEEFGVALAACQAMMLKMSFYEIDDAAYQLNGQLETTTDVDALNAMAETLAEATASLKEINEVYADYDVFVQKFKAAAEISEPKTTEAAELLEFNMYGGAGMQATSLEALAQAVETIKADYFTYIANANLLDGNMFDLTYLIQNPNIDHNLDGWTLTGRVGRLNNNGFNGVPGIMEIGEWGATSWEAGVSQNLNELPNGKYIVKMAWMAASGIKMNLSANEASVEVIGIGDQGGNIAADGSVVEMGQGVQGWQYAEVEVFVEDGTLAIAVNSSSAAQYQWSNADQFQLYYAGDISYLYDLDEPIEGEWEDVTYGAPGEWAIIDDAELLGLGEYWTHTGYTNYDNTRGVMEFVAGEKSSANLRQDYCPFYEPATYRLTGKAFHMGATNAVMFVEAYGDVLTVEIPAAAEGATFENAEEYFTTFSIEFEVTNVASLNVGYSCEFESADASLVVGGFKLEKKASTSLRKIFMETIMALESLGYQIGGMEALHADQQAMMAKAMPIYEAIQGGQKVLKSEVEQSIEDMQAVIAELNPVATYYKGEFMDALYAAEDFKWTLDEASQAYADLEAAINEANDVAAVTTVAELEAKVAALEELMKLIETGIDSIEAEVETVIYDLSGRRVTEMTKGVYIVNGKKVIKK